MKYLKIVLILTFTFYSCSSVDKCVSGDCNNGRGTKHYKNGDRYVGEFKESNHDGDGTLFNASNGERYTGKFVKGQPHGTGTLYDKENQIVFTGEWENGKRKE
jgi:hypothetical protein